MGKSSTITFLEVEKLKYVQTALKTTHATGSQRAPQRKDFVLFIPETPAPGLEAASNRKP